jgi:peptidoglycan/LPS O-acetylase OafA/YrhL
VVPASDPDHSHPSRLPSLDGLRALSIALVIAGHLTVSHTLPAWLQRPSAYLWRLDPGNLGVRIFFVISGYLITGLLIAEHQASGSISLSRFYLRRTARIMPAFYVFLTAMAIAAGLNLIHIPSSALLHAGTYTSNYVHTAWSVGHSWSLSVEEQFYLLWPGLLVLLGLRRGFGVALLVLALSPLLRLTAVLQGNWPDNPRYAFECVADALATGCLLAWGRGKLWEWRPYRRLLESRGMVIWPLLVLVIAGAMVKIPRPAEALVGITLLNLAIAVGVDWVIRFPTSYLGTLLNAPAVAFVGVMSYSLYLWQQPFLSPYNRVRFPLNLVGIALAALGSYFLVERPVLRLRAKLSHRAPRPFPSILRGAVQSSEPQPHASVAIAPH